MSWLQLPSTVILESKKIVCPFSQFFPHRFAMKWCQAPLSIGILQASILEWLAIFFSRGLPNPENKLRSPALQVDSSPTELWGKPWSDETRCHNLSFWVLSFKTAFSLSSFTFINRILLFVAFCDYGGITCISEVDICPDNLDSSLWFIQPSILHDVL